jgi:hypothetical protein
MASEKARALEYSTRFDYKSIMIYSSLPDENNDRPLYKTRSGDLVWQGGNANPELGGPSQLDIERVAVLYPNNMSTHRKTHQEKGRPTQTLWKPHPSASLRRLSHQYRPTPRDLLTIRARVRCRPIRRSQNVGSLYQTREKRFKQGGRLMACGRNAVMCIS